MRGGGGRGCHIYYYSTLTGKQILEVEAQVIKATTPSTLNSALASIARSRNPHNAITIYNLILSRNSPHDHLTYSHVLKAAASLPPSPSPSPNHEEIHSHLIKSGHLSDIFLLNSLLHIYLLRRQPLSAARLFLSIPSPDDISWNSLISGLCNSGHYQDALLCFSTMPIPPTSPTLVSLLSASSRLPHPPLGKAIHAYGLRHLPSHDLFFYNALLHFHLSCGSPISAFRLFLQMPTLDVVSWTTVIGGLAHAGLPHHSLNLFTDMMVGRRVEPNETTLVTVLYACSSVGALGMGEWVHRYIDEKEGITSVDGSLGNALVNMYVKCGCMGKAMGVFRRLRCKDVVAWSTVICGMAMRGAAPRAMEIFGAMLVQGVRPDAVVFIGLLTACSHGGLVGRGVVLFRAMQEVYKMVPWREHYVCMVDMYGRAGMVERAEELIRGMEGEVGGAVWGAVVSACRVHGEGGGVFERARVGVEGAAGVGVGTYTMLSNAYTGYHNWVDANRVRDEMRFMGLKKVPGLTSVIHCHLHHSIF